MKRQSFFFSAASLFIVLIAGCGGNSSVPLLNTSPNQEIIEQRGVDTTYTNLIRIVSSDELLEYVKIINPFMGKTGAYTKVQVTLQNLTLNRFTLEYQCQWQDAIGFAAGTPRPWTRLVLTSREAEIVQEVALHPKAVKAVFTIRLPDDDIIELNKNVK